VILIPTSLAARLSRDEMRAVLLHELVHYPRGDLFVVGITKLFSKAGAGNDAASVSTGRFFLYAGLTFIVAILFSVVATSYRYRDEAAARGK